MCLDFCGAKFFPSYKIWRIIGAQPTKDVQSNILYRTLCLFTVLFTMTLEHTGDAVLDL
jgi:hypothetical protein